MRAFTVSSVGRALRRRHWLVWGTALLAAAIAYGAAQTRPPTYQATAVLSVDESQVTNQGFDIAIQADEYLIQRYVALANSRPLMQQVCAQEGQGCDPAQLAKRVRVNTPKAIGQIEIVADAPTADGAARLANEVARQLVVANRAQVEAQFGPERDYLTQQLNDLNDRQAQTMQQLQPIEAAGRSNSGLLAQLTNLQVQYQSTYDRLQELDVQRSRMSNALTFDQPALPPGRPADPDLFRYLLVGTGAGLAAGILLALIAERLRTRIQQGPELAEAAGSPVVLDLSRSRRPGDPGPLGFLVRASLGERQDSVRGLLVVGATGRERVNDVGLALAEAISEERRRVLLVLADSVSAGAPERREIATGDAGRVVAVAGSAAAARALRDSGSPDGFDFVVRCSLPPMQEPGLTWLRATPEPAILVATRGRTRFHEAKRTVDLLGQVGVRVVGAVLLPTRMKALVVAGRKHEPAQTKPALGR